MNPTIRAIVTDIDGTLLNSQHELSERNRRALRRAAEQGVAVILATGKTRASAESFIEQLGLDTPGIYVQGLLLYDADGSIRFEHTLDPGIVRQVYDLTEDEGHTVIAYSRNRIFMGRPRQWCQDMLLGYHEPAAEPIEPFESIIGREPVNKVVVFCEEERIGALREHLAASIDGHARLVQAVPMMLEIMPAGVSKATALRRLLAELGIEPGEVMAIGDGENDVEMLKLVGLGVAVANATEVAKAAADVVVGSNNEDGVAEAVERFVLKAPAEQGEERRP
ncbi:MAG TPA: HAD family hydrolase [Aggregatilineales bacterium]|nr:HAD family hydrolase [Aggregatilineales bacterium]